mmetsp:Transcript_2749/g.5189  ORF Transcript_2749/g.5189 Transcript_2749/m.5189 type:complete len:291 (-) Transcript_2749:211-1083(-)
MSDADQQSDINHFGEIDQQIEIAERHMQFFPFMMNEMLSHMVNVGILWFRKVYIVEHMLLFRRHCRNNIHQKRVRQEMIALFNLLILIDHARKINLGRWHTHTHKSIVVDIVVGQRGCARHNQSVLDHCHTLITDHKALRLFHANMTNEREKLGIASVAILIFLLQSRRGKNLIARHENVTFIFLTTTRQCGKHNANALHTARLDHRIDQFLVCVLEQFNATTMSFLWRFIQGIDLGAHQFAILLIEQRRRAHFLFLRQIVFNHFITTDQISAFLHHIILFPFLFEAKIR